MFKFIEIHITEPICSCEYENLSWDLDIDFEELEFAGVIIKCDICDEELYIYREEFGAYFRFDDDGYPCGRLVVEEDDDDEEEEVEDRPFLQLIRGGKDGADG
jgi:hypothetical protein